MFHKKIRKQINEALKQIKKGGVIIYPSESCYSFGCSAFNKKAIEKIHNIKHDAKNKPYSILISNINQLRNLAVLNKTAKTLINKLMPCQLNLIVEKNPKVKLYFSKESSLSFRIPSNKIAHQLCKSLKSPIITTSVNIHGKPALYNIEEVKKQFSTKVDYIIDSGDLNKDIPVSTIFDTRNNKIARKGPISLKEIKSALKTI